MVGAAFIRRHRHRESSSSQVIADRLGRILDLSFFGGKKVQIEIDLLVWREENRNGNGSSIWREDIGTPTGHRTLLLCDHGLLRAGSTPGIPSLQAHPQSAEPLKNLANR